MPPAVAEIYYGKHEDSRKWCKGVLWIEDFFLAFADSISSANMCHNNF